MYKLIKKVGLARCSDFFTPHGVIKLPAFMNVATCAAIKGGLSALDLKKINCQVMLCNTYHLHLRPGDEVIKKFGGLQKFTSWKNPILTDSGGFQVFSLAKLRKIHEIGVEFYSHIDGRKIFLTPETSIQIQSNLASTIAMAFDECVKIPSEYDYIKTSCERTVRWLKRCKEKLFLLNQNESTLNKKQMLFGINQGGIYKNLRIENAKKISDLNLDGYAVGGLAVGETADEMYEIIEAVAPFLPFDKPRYLMGVGTPVNILEAINRGIDLFDCVMPSRNARHGHFFTWKGILNIFNKKYEFDDSFIDKNCNCTVCKNFSRGYIRHLFKSKEILALRLAVTHNLYFYNEFFEKIRSSIADDTFQFFYENFKQILSNKL